MAPAVLALLLLVAVASPCAAASAQQYPPPEVEDLNGDGSVADELRYTARHVQNVQERWSPLNPERRTQMLDEVQTPYRFQQTTSELEPVQGHALPAPAYRPTRLIQYKLFRERQHVGGWLGVGEDLPVPVTSGPPQFTSNDYAPTNLVDAPDRSSGEMRFRSVRGSTTEPAALLPEPASSEGPFGGSDPRAPSPHAVLRVPQELQERVLFSEAERDPLFGTEAPPMAAPPPS